MQICRENNFSQGQPCSGFGNPDQEFSLGRLPLAPHRRMLLVDLVPPNGAIPTVRDVGSRSKSSVASGVMTACRDGMIAFAPPHGGWGVTSARKKDHFMAQASQGRRPLSPVSVQTVWRRNLPLLAF